MQSMQTLCHKPKQSKVKSQASLHVMAVGNTGMVQHKIEAHALTLTLSQMTMFKLS